MANKRHSTDGKPVADGQATRATGNVAGQKAARQSGASGTAAQGGTYGRRGGAGHTGHVAGLRKGTVDTEESED